ncbi:hypothetical protein G3O06_05545 [Burkholderia sp. Ac-20345]|uniref:hypothetical protein n=1 Tax=Burkholderia sp. Ac-20345 TaxID=2703891 RepID=UPI00197B0F31|nr:hypothetical protein [Burkholderia sp. Ac-20345]MBN3777034.1 hypothetical protein [Burkholderia sp. Ac-20345]
MNFDSILRRLGLVRHKDLTAQLNFARSVGKRLDEHREVVETLSQSSFFDEHWWHAGHLATQDDYLMRLYFMVHGKWPVDDPASGHRGFRRNGEYVRPRPPVLGQCRLPEFEVANAGESR